MTNTPLLPPNIVKQIPVEFAPLLISGYNIPISFFETSLPSGKSYFNAPVIVLEHEIDKFLEQYPEHIENEHFLGQNGEIKIIQKD